MSPLRAFTCLHPQQLHGGSAISSPSRGGEHHSYWHSVWAILQKWDPFSLLLLHAVLAQALPLPLPQQCLTSYLCNLPHCLHPTSAPGQPLPLSSSSIPPGHPGTSPAGMPGLEQKLWGPDQLSSQANAEVNFPSGKRLRLRTEMIYFLLILGATEFSCTEQHPCIEQLGALRSRFWPMRQVTWAPLPVSRPTLLLPHQDPQGKRKGIAMHCTACPLTSSFCC